MQNVEKTIEYIRNGGNGSAGNELLSEFFRGYPVVNVLRMLDGPEDALVSTGAFIASELGHAAAPIVADLEPYLNHTLVQVRFDLIDSILMCAEPRHGSVIAAAVRLVDDSEKVIRSRVHFWLARIGRGQLLASLEFLGDGDLADRVHWLASIRTNPQSILEKLGSISGVDRLFGVTAAVRIALLGGSMSPLREATRSDDFEVSTIAKDAISSEYALSALSE